MHYKKSTLDKCKIKAYFAKQVKKKFSCGIFCNILLILLLLCWVKSSHQNMFKEKQEDTDPPKRCSSELAKQRGRSCLFKVAGGRKGREKKSRDRAQREQRESYSWRKGFLFEALVKAQILEKIDEQQESKEAGKRRSTQCYFCSGKVRGSLEVLQGIISSEKSLSLTHFPIHTRKTSPTPSERVFNNGLTEL